jgi:cephalosporin hydroxylase
MLERIAAHEMTEPNSPFSAPDDRKSFDDAKTIKAIQMSNDEALSTQAANLLSAVRTYDWSYQWTWLGLPIIQIPSDIVAMQEIIWSTRPQLVVETGVARGGSIMLYAGILELIGEGTVVGVDIDIRTHNRAEIENHLLWDRIELIEGSSVDPRVVDRVAEMAGLVERTMVVLDSDHSHDHVLAELRAYGPLVTAGQYLVVADTVIEQSAIEDRVRHWGPGNSPATALSSYMTETDRFVKDELLEAKLLLTSSPGGYLRCVR